MYIQRNKSKYKNGTQYISTLLCHKYRKEGKIKTKVLCNLSPLPAELIESIENILKSKTQAVVKEEDIFIESCYDFGYIYVIEQLMKRLRINETLEKILPKSTVKLVKSMIIGKLITKGSKLSIFNWLEREKELSQRFGLEMNNLKLDDFYSSLAVLRNNKDKLDKQWFRYHNSKGNCIFLYDITSVYFEGTENELADFGYNRDGKKGKKQIFVGLVTDAFGNPLRVEVFKGNTNDSQTVEEQILKLKIEFQAETIIFVGDRGMRIKYNINNSEDLKNSGIQFITGLTKNEIKGLITDGIIEHFRDLKSDNICIRPVYHRNEAQTIGHIQICFYALVIIKELEKHIYPFLLEINKNRTTKLSFNDMLAELNKIKICELIIGKKATTLKIPKLNETQKKIFEILNLNENQMLPPAKWQCSN